MSFRRTREMGSDNDITIQCTIMYKTCTNRYKTRDEGHENSTRLLQILVDGGTVIPRSFLTVIVGRL